MYAHGSERRVNPNRSISKETHIATVQNENNTAIITIQQQQKRHRFSGVSNVHKHFNHMNYSGWLYKKRSSFAVRLRLQTADHSDIFVPRARSTHFRCCSFCVCGPTIWNKLPQDVWSIAALYLWNLNQEVHRIKYETAFMSTTAVIIDPLKQFLDLIYEGHPLCIGGWTHPPPDKYSPEA